jgi:hypothetical protein
MLGVTPIGLHAIPAGTWDLGAATTHSTRRRASSRASPYPVGPASYATRTGPGNPAQNRRAINITDPVMHMRHV